MPGMSGYDVARQINDSKSGIQDLPLIALSSLMEGDARKCEDAGFDGFLSKPVRREKLFQMMERLLGEEIETKRLYDAPVARQSAAQNSIITQYSLHRRI